MKILRYFTVSLALVMLLVTSCTKEEIEVAPEVSLEPVASDMTSVTFRITSENAVDAAYIRLKDLTQVPSARAILAGGEKVPVPGQDVVLSGLTPGETYYMAAAAVSEGEVYSEVKTLEMSTSGENCTFGLTISSTTQESILYSVVPSNETTRFYVSALEASEYAEAGDGELVAAVAEQVNALASEAGVSLQDYLSGVLMSGEQTNNIISGLTPDTEYVVFVFGMSAEDASATTEVVRETARTYPEAPELTFTLTATDITTTTAHVTVTPSDMNATYVWLCQPASNYPGITPDNPDALAEAYVASVGQLLDAGMGLYTGSYDIADFDVMSDTEYYLFAFGYTSGVGITSSCELLTFKTERGIMPEDFEADIIVDATTSKVISFRVVPKENYESIYYGCAVIPSSEYTEQAAIDAVEGSIIEYYNMQVEFNPSYSMADAVSSVCSRGEDWFEPHGLIPETEYVLAAVSVSNEGKAAKVVTTTAETAPDIVSNATFTNTLIGIYDGNEALEAGLFPESTKLKDKGVAVFEFERSEEAVECYYFLANGDYSNPEEEFKTDDDLLSWITTNPYFFKVEEGTSHAFIEVDFYDAYSYLGYYYTLLSVAKDANGTWGPISRTLFLPKYAERGDIQDLVDLINAIESQSTQNILLVR